jgi:hypothetical protein
MSTRERKIKFIKNSGEKAFRMRVLEAYAMHGEDWFTDEQLDDMVRDEIDCWKSAQRRDRENRKLRSTG